MIKNKKYDKQIASELNDCFESILAGKDTIESCLARYPQHAAELKPLLETMKAARAASSLTPDASFRARARYEFRRALDDSLSPQEPAIRSWRWRWATIASTAGVLLLTSTGGVVAASSGSMPGQALYQVKRSIETVQITLAPSQAAKARLYAALADRRISEIVYTANNLKDAGLIEDLTQQFTQDLSNVSANATPNRALTFGNDSKQAGTASVNASSPEQAATTSVTATSNATVAPGLTPYYAPSTTAAPTASVAPATTAVWSNVTPPGTQAAPASTPTIVVSYPPPVTVTQVNPVTPVITLPQQTISLSGITDPALLKLLQQYSIKNLAELMAILDKLSPDVKAAVLAAIEAASSGYGQLLGS